MTKTDGVKGAGWVHFRPKFLGTRMWIVEYCRKNSRRNTLTPMPGGTFVWTRLPLENGAGVGYGKQLGDFQKVLVAATLSGVSIGPLETNGWKGRTHLAEHLAEVIDHGWRKTAEDAKEKVETIRLDLTIQDGKVTGQVVHD